MIEILIDRFQHKAGSAVQNGKTNHLLLNKSRVDRFKGYSTAKWDQPSIIGERYPLNVFMKEDYENVRGQE
jgi:hypothetical protein